MFDGRIVSAVIPALNEEQSIARVVAELVRLDSPAGGRLIDEVVVCDNGSTDQTASRAHQAGARVVSEPRPGYGRACQRALQQVSDADIILFIDADYAFYSEQVIDLLRPLSEGADIVIGSRTLGRKESGALTVSQQFGNWLATFLVRLLWGYRISDLGPFRAIDTSALARLNMCDERFGWTIEMQVKAIQKELVMVEVPVDTRRRLGYSKISGTLKGVIGAGLGIIGMILRLRLEQASRCSCEASTPIVRESK